MTLEPVRPPEAESEAPLAAPPCDGEIFIVDDDPAVRFSLWTAFTNAGFRTRTFIDGTIFLALARTEKPACIILDVYMPQTSGLDVLKALAAADCQAPIFMLSGQGDIPLAIDAVKRGAFDFLEKQWGAEAIVTRVAETLRERGRPALDAGGS